MKPITGWRRYVVYRTEALRTTWIFRLAVLASIVIAVSATQRLWAPSVGRSLACREEVGPSDVILVENFDPNYLLFERAAALQRRDRARRVLVPTEADARDAAVPNPVGQGVAEVMARVARVENLGFIPTQETEPISLNAAYQIRDALLKQRVRSVTVVAPAFRSRRSSLVYQAVLGPAGIDVACIPVFGDQTPENWTTTWHGIQNVTEQFLKLQFYRFYVLPWRLHV